MTPIEFIGFAAAALSCMSLLPELHQALRTHHLKDVAWGMILLMTISSLFWLVYGTYNNLMPLIVSASIQIALQITLMGLKLLYDKNKKPLIIMPWTWKKRSKNTEPAEETIEEAVIEENQDPIDGPFISESNDETSEETGEKKKSKK
jgi:MtN3 and saliva related transmembrane protein